MESPLHPTPMQRPMMKGKIYVDASNKPTFQGIWGMTHADVNKGGHTNDFKVVRMESVKEHEIGLPVFAGKYIGYFKLTTGFQTETVHEDFTLTFRGHSNHGYNVYGSGENRYGRNEIVGTVTQTGKMEIFKMLPGTTVQPDPSEPAPALPRPANPRAISPPPPSVANPMARPLGMATPARAGGVGGARPKSGGSTKKKPVKRTPTAPPPSKNGLPGVHVRTLKDCLLMLKKTDKNNVFQFPVPPHFRGLKGLYADVIKNPMDLGTVSKQIDSKYRTVKECIADVRLVFSNAKDFNPDTDPVHALAASLSGKFEAFVSNNRNILGLDGSTPGSGSGSFNKSPVAPSTSPSASASMALSANSANAGANIGKRIGTPPSMLPSGGGGAVKDGGGGAGVAVLSAEEQEQLAKDVNHLFHVGNANPNNDRAQARVYALWTFAKAYVADKDRVAIDGGKGAEIKMDALNHVRQRQLRDVVSFFMQDSKNDPKPEKSAADAHADSVKPKLEEGNKTTASGEGESSSSGRPGKRPRSDVSDSENEDDDDEDAEGGDGVSPSKPSRDDSEASKGEGLSADGEGKEKKLKPSNSNGSEPNGSTGAAADEAGAQNSATTAPFGRVNSSSLTLEATASTLKETEIDIDLDEDEDEDDEEDGSGGPAGGAGGAGSGSGGEGGDGGSGEGSSKAATTGKMDEQWLQAQAERKEREEREKARAESEKALEEQRLRQQAQREKERVEEGLRLSRERAAEKARLEKAALEKANREKKELEDKKEAERLAREGTKASVDLDQVRADSQLMELMDESIYDD